MGGDKGYLIDMVDDATGKTPALLSEEETTKAAMKLLWSWVKKYCHQVLHRTKGGLNVNIECIKTGG